MNTRKLAYGILMALAFIGAAFFWCGVPFPPQSVVAFHWNTAPVTWRVIADVAIVATLTCLAIVSWLNFRVAIDAKHVTTIARK